LFFEGSGGSKSYFISIAALYILGDFSRKYVWRAHYRACGGFGDGEGSTVRGIKKMPRKK